MTELFIGLGLVATYLLTLHGYIKICSHKYYKDQYPKTLSDTFYKTGWKFRVLLIVLALLLIYPILLATGIHTTGGWLYYAPYSLLSWSKVAYAITIGGIIGVALNANGHDKSETKAHGFSASILAAGGAIVASLLRHDWYVGLIIWLGCLAYYLIKNHKYHKWGLFIELVAFDAIGLSLAAYMIINYIL